MKTIPAFVLIFTLFIAGFVQPSFAGCAKCRLLSGFGLGTVRVTSSDRETSAQASGPILSIQEVEPENNVIAGVYILIKGKDSNTAVRLGNKSALSRGGINLEPYDEVSVKGYSVMTAREKPAIIATEITKNGKTLSLSN